MNRHNLNIQITTDPNAVVGQKNPAECYAELVLDDAKTGFQKYRWELIPNKGQPAAPTFLIIDDEQGLVSHLSKGESDGKFAKFTMTTTGADGCIVYSSMEMVSPEEPDSVLRDIYVCRADYVMEQETGKAAAPEPIDPEDDSSIVDEFVQALLTDARARTHSLTYSRQPDDSFICESFGISETRIVLKKEFETNHSDKYSVSLEYPDGSEVVSCMEVSELDVDSDLRELYTLISQQYPETYTDIAVRDTERFICNMRYQRMLDRALSNDLTSVNTEVPLDEKGGCLVMDVIKAAPAPRVIARHLIDELNKRKGVLPEAESVRIRELVESTINSITHYKREPNGSTFPGKDNPCCWSLSSVANAWTNLPASVYGVDVDMNSKTVMTRVATLIVASVLCEQLK